MGDYRSFIRSSLDKLTSLMKSNVKEDFQGVISIIMEAVQHIECHLEKGNKAINKYKLKLCLMQLKYSLNKISEVLNDDIYLNKMDIYKLISKKMYLCFNTILLMNDETTCNFSSQRTNYHSLMTDVISALSLTPSLNEISNLIDDFLCSSLTIAKLSDCADFKEISASCKNVLNAVLSLKNDSIRSGNEVNVSYLSYHITLLDRKVNTAMLRLFLQIMSYPHETLKKMVKKCGSTTAAKKFSEDLDDEIGDFDLTCDRIALIGNFAIMSCEQEPLKLQVQNCLANLEFCEESLVPSCIDYYLDPNNEKRIFLKYLCNEWKSEVLVLSNLLDSIVDPAAFSLVVFDDLSGLVQQIRTTDLKNQEVLFPIFYQRCMKLMDSITKSPDCSSDAFISEIKKSLHLELKTNEIKTCTDQNFKEKVQHLEVVLSVVDQISEHLNRTLNSFKYHFEDLSQSTQKDISFKDSSHGSGHQEISLGTNDWEVSYLNNKNKYDHNKTVIPSCYLEKANQNSPFIFTMYQKTPIRKKVKDNVALSLDISR